MTQPAMSTLLNEQLISLSQLAARIKSHRRQGSLSTQAIWRWVTRGLMLPDGRMVKLESVRLAGRFLTSWPAFQRFLVAQTPGEAEVLPVPTRSPAKRKRAGELAGQALKSAGI
jgi:hypothetical protein